MVANELSVSRGGLVVAFVGLFQDAALRMVGVFDFGEVADRVDDGVEVGWNGLAEARAVGERQDRVVDWCGDGTVWVGHAWDWRHESGMWQDGRCSVVEARKVKRGHVRDRRRKARLWQDRRRRVVEARSGQRCHV